MDEDEGGELILAGPWDVTNAPPTLHPGVLDLVRGPKELGFKWAVNCGSGWVSATPIALLMCREVSSLSLKEVLVRREGAGRRRDEA